MLGLMGGIVLMDKSNRERRHVARELRALGEYQKERLIGVTGIASDEAWLYLKHAAQRLGSYSYYDALKAGIAADVFSEAIEAAESE